MEENEVPVDLVLLCIEERSEYLEYTNELDERYRRYEAYEEYIRQRRAAGYDADAE